MYGFRVGITTYDFLPIVDGYESGHEHGHSHENFEEEAGILGILQVRRAKKLCVQLLSNWLTN